MSTPHKAPALPLAILTLPFYVLVPAFYTQSLALPIAAVGQVLLAVRLIDAFADPIVGVLADRWRPSAGRRRLWVAAATPFVVVAAWQVFRPGEGAGLTHLAVWASLLSIAWTCSQIPYAAWGAELSSSYAGRSRVSAFREGLTVVGTLLALAAPAILPALGWPGERAALSAFAFAAALLLPLAVATAVAVVPEPPDLSTRQTGWREGLGHLRANRRFVRLIVAFLVNGLANGLPATLFLFFVQRKLQSPDSAGPLLVLYFVCGILGVPFWLMLARRTSKHRAWCLGMLLSCMAFLAAPLLGPGDVLVFAAVVVVTGLALGADVILPASIQADVIDVDTAASGQQRAGLYMALWALATKLALAAAVGIAFPLLGAAGFDPAAGIETPRGLLVLGLLYAALPVVLKLGSVALVWRFPLDESSHAALRAAIEARRRD